MRYIFFTLLLVNLAYFAYQQSRPRSVPEAHSTPVQATGVVTIVLAREVVKRSERTRQLSQVVNNPIYGAPNGVPNGVPNDNPNDTPYGVTADTSQCPALGPLADLFAGQNLVEKLEAMEFDVVLRAVDKPSGDSDYRVLIPPVKTLQDAFRKLRELKFASIDSYVITQGPDALGISLGLFSSREAAEVARSGFVGDGYETTIREIARLDREYWVFAPEARTQLVIGLGIWDSIVAEFPEIQQKMRICTENNS